jgi:hypothetical protein
VNRGRRAAYGRRLRGALVVPAVLGCAEAGAISLDEERALERLAAADTLIAHLPDDALDRLRADLPAVQRVRARLLALPPPEPVP